MSEERGDPDGHPRDRMPMKTKLLDLADECALFRTRRFFLLDRFSAPVHVW